MNLNSLMQRWHIALVSRELGIDSWYFFVWSEIRHKRLTPCFQISKLYALENILVDFLPV